MSSVKFAREMYISDLFYFEKWPNGSILKLIDGAVLVDWSRNTENNGCLVGASQ